MPTFESCLTSILWVNRWWVGGLLILTSFGVFLSQQIAKDFLLFSFFFLFVSFPFQTSSLLSSFSSKFIGWNIFYLSIHLYPPLSSSLFYYPPLSSSLFIIHLFHHLSLLLSTSFIIISLLLSTSFIFSLSYYYFFDAALLVCACCNSYFVLLGQICFSHFFSPFSQTNYYSRQEISTNLPVKIVM